MIGIGAYVFYLWLEDLEAEKAGTPNPGALPGARGCTRSACLIAALGSLVILVAETLGEIGLRISEQQSKITVLFGLYSLVAAFVEELIFRGYLVIDGKGERIRWLGILAASLLFSALHPFLWQWDTDGFSWTPNAKGWFSTLFVFVSSLWFYLMRFSRFNKTHSLLPCIVAHVTKNAGVFAIKAVQGFVGGIF